MDQPCYFIARITIHDPHEYQQYLNRASAVFQKFNGRYLSVDNHPQVLEGEWDCTRTVLIEFPSPDDFNRWYYSPEYQQILRHRLQGAECHAVLVKGRE